MRAQIKICGLTRIADLVFALRHDIDYVGCIMDIPRSPRSLSPSSASRLLRCARGQGVVVTDSADGAMLAALSHDCSLAALQLHGAQTPEAVAEVRRQVGREVELWGVLAMPVEEASAAAALPSLVTRARELFAARNGLICFVNDTR